MAFNRSPKSVRELLAEVRRYLRDDEADLADDERQWTEQELRDYGNLSIDLRAAQMGLTGEHAITKSVVIDVVDGVRAYPLPAMILRPEQIFLRFEDGSTTRELPLRRDDRLGGSYVAPGSWPTVRLQGNLIMLEPAVNESRVRGLRLEGQFLPARLLPANAPSTELAQEILDPSFPDLYERLFVLDVVYYARARPTDPQEMEPAFAMARSKLERTFEQVISLRLQNRVFTKPFLVS